jgi:hypothetical protein
MVPFLLQKHHLQPKEINSQRGRNQSRRETAIGWLRDAGLSSRFSWRQVASSSVVPEQVRRTAGSERRQAERWLRGLDRIKVAANYCDVTTLKALL